MPPSRKSNNSNDKYDSDIINEINQQLTEADEYVAKKMKRNDNSSVDSSEIPDIITDEMLSDINDQSIDETTTKKLDEEAKQAYLENDVFDAIVQFMKTDDLIKEKESVHREEVSPLKKHRTDLEIFLIDYLEQIEQEYIKVGEKTQLTKVETVTKGPIKPDNVAEALLEGFKKHELYTEDQHDEMVRVIKDMMKIVESKRDQKVKKKISRVNLEKQAKKEAQEASKANADKINKKVNNTKQAKQKAKGAKPKAAPKAAPKAKATKSRKVTKTVKK